MLKSNETIGPAGIKRHLWVFLCLAIVITLIYSNSFDASFHLDDQNIIDNRNLHPRSLSISELKKSFYGSPTFKNVIYRPAACLTFALNYYVGGEKVFGYHVVNCSIHLITAFFLYLLVYLTLRLPSLEERYGKDAYHIAFLTGALWATHPVQTGAVTYIIQRMTSMAAMFYVMSLYFYAKGRLGVRSKKPFYFTLCSISAILAFCSKENTAILPLTIIAYEIFFLQEFDWKRCIKWVKGHWALFIIMALFGLLCLGPRINLKFFSQILESRDFSLTERVLTQFRVIIHYLTLLLYPSSNRLNLDYDFPVSHSLFDPPTTFLSMIVIIALITWSLYVMKKKPLISFCILWFFINLAIESSIIPLEMVFEHRLYLPSMGFFVLVATAFIKAIDYFRFRARVRYVLAMAICMLIFLQAIGTYTRNFVWKDDLTLWTDCVKKSPKKARSHLNLGNAYYDLTERYDLALEEFQTAIEFDPRESKAHNNLGLVYVKKHQFEVALKSFKKAISIDGDTDAHYNLANVYKELKLYNEAIKEYLKTIETDPKFSADAHYNLANVYKELKLYNEAIKEYLNAIKANPYLADCYNNLAFIYYQEGSYQKALSWLKRGIEVDPSRTELYGNLAAVYKNLGMDQEMVGVLKKAEKITKRGRQTHK